MPKITAIVGRNGSGKTQYVEQMRRQLATDSMRYIAFADSYGPNVDAQYYLQLRWNQHDIDRETPTVGELLENAYRTTGTDNAGRCQWKHQLYTLFQLEPLLDKYVISLSSGELRKFQLTKILFSHPKLLILDNPFIGLDAPTRSQLSDLLQLLSHEHHMELILVLSKTDDIPTYITEVVEFPENADGKPLAPCSLSDYLQRQARIPLHVLTEKDRESLLSLPYHEKDYDCKTVIRMNHVNIRYGQRTIIKDLNWTVENGERWALCGENGSGKSTLLSLVSADNPQAYACDITLFDRPRGSGETIWDIKRHIGYVSPEMHRSYKRNIAAIRIVASGLTDSIGLYVNPAPRDYDRCQWWLTLFGVGHLAHRPFLQLSSGEQRLVLLARAFVKDPQLLIMDEPLHGLDQWNRRLVKDIMETFCQRQNKTMIMVTHYQEELPSNITHQLYLQKNS